MSIDAPSSLTLDNPAWEALTGAHAHLAERSGRAARYRGDVSPFHALDDPADPTAWTDLARLVGPGGVATLVGPAHSAAGWDAVQSVPGVRLVADTLKPAPDREALVLGASDVPEMLDLVARTRPGPFLPHTVDLGRYVGFRIDGALVAMAGERLRPAGATEISAVCTDPGHRGRGLASRLIRDVAAAIVARGDVPFLHTAADNHTAIALYRTLGFTPPQAVAFTTFRAPDPRGSAATRAGDR